MTAEERIKALETIVANISANYHAPHLIDARACLTAFEALLDDMRERYQHQQYLGSARTLTARRIEE